MVSQTKFYLFISDSLNGEELSVIISQRYLSVKVIGPRLSTPCSVNNDSEVIWRVLLTVKAFLAQAKEDFNQKWETPSQVGLHCAQFRPIGLYVGSHAGAARSV